jgi:hypothetical protein
MTKYRVYSGDSESAVLEVIRTDERVAKHDAQLIKEIIGRPAWVEEVRS